MEQIAPLGTAISQILRPTQQIYGALLKPNAAKIKSTPRKTFSYGNDARQNLDVYYPSQNPSGDGCPILIFLYGGGLVYGARTLSTVDDELVYANLGHFFAETGGFVVVVPDYRVVPQARFPSGGEDLAMTIEWIRSNTEEFGAGGPYRDLYLMGNSAGGIHLSTYLFNPVFSESRKYILKQAGEGFLQLKRAILLSVPFHFEVADPARRPILQAYYGDRTDDHCPFGLLKSLKAQSNVRDVLPGVEFLSLVGTLEPEDEVLVPTRDFVNTWNAGDANSEQNLLVEVIDGHNHISPPFALSTGHEKDEEWGHRVVRFCSESVNH